MVDNLGHVESKHYSAEITSPYPWPPGWRVAAHIIRNDSKEMVERLVASADSKDSAVRLAKELARNYILQLTEPVDWGRDPEIPLLIRLYGQWREEAAAAQVRIQESHPPGNTSEAVRIELDRIDEYWRMLLTERVNALSLDQQVALVSPTSEQLAKRANTWVEDEIIAKEALYSLLQDPRPEVLQAKLRADELLNKGI